MQINPRKLKKKLKNWYIVINLCFRLLTNTLRNPYNVSAFLLFKLYKTVVNSHIKV